MSFAAYDSDALRVMSSAMSAAMKVARMSSKRSLTESEVNACSRHVATKLMGAFDNGERNPDALKRMALEEVSMGRVWR